MPARRLILALIAVLAVALAGCSQESSEDSGKASADRAAKTRGGGEAEKKEASGDPQGAAAGGPPVEEILKRKKPKVTIPDGEPPAKLQIKDLIKGSGPAARSGKGAAVNYVGKSYSTGKEFDTSFGKQPFQFQLGAGMVIPGWDKGLEGMKVGGRRELIVPAADGYGEQGQPPTIKGGETLVFVIDLIAVQK